ncbi:hypothetical protein [Nonomuraea salmonea]|uniref:hypothetical protein n=1 Tax=Nonomuraea salmonea TaxID=46181 RepID=UPI0031E63BD9
MASDQQQETDSCQGLAVIGVDVAVFRDQPAQQVVARPGLLARDQVADVPAQPQGGVASLLARRVAAEDDRGSALELAAVGVGHSQQFADHQRGHGERHGLHQIGRPRSCQHLVDGPVGDALDLRPHLLDPPDRELVGDHAPVP